MLNADKKLTNNGNSLASQASLQLLPLIMQNIPQAVFWKDQNLVYLGCNRAFAEDAGFASPEDVIGKTDFDMPWKKQAELYRADDRRVLESGEAKLNYEEPQTTPAGATTWLRTSKIPVCENGRAVAILGMYEDITERKQAEILQKQSERLFQALFEMSPDAVTLIDPYDPSHQWPIVDCNTAACQINGYTREELIGQPITILNAPTDMPINPVEYLAQLREQGTLNYEILHRRKDGTIFPVEVSTSLIKIGDRELLLGIDRDITERKHAEQALRDSEAMYSAVVTQARDGVVILQDNMVQFVNQAMGDMVGYSPSEMADTTMIDYIAPDSKELLVNRMKARLTGEEVPPTYEARLRHKNGTILDAELSANVIEYQGRPADVVIIRNITERKQADAQLQQEKSFSETILNGLPGIFYLFDTQGKMVRWNKQYEQMMGFTPEEAAATNAIDAFVDEDKEHVMAVIQRVFTGARETVEGRFLTKDGRHVPHYLTGQVLQMGDQVYLAGTGIDLTERKRAEQAVSESEERFRRFTEATIEGMIFHERGQIIDLNPAAVAMIGFSEAKELIGRNLLEFIVPELHQMVLMKMQSQTVQPYEIQCIHRDGSTFPVETSTRAYKLGDREIRASSMRNITERKQAEKAIAESEERFKRFTEATLEGLVFHDLGKVIDANPAATTMFGFSATEEAIGRNLLEFISPEYHQLVLKQMQLGSVAPYEIQCVRLDGARFPVETSTRTYQVGEHTLRATSLRDISERKQAEVALQQEQALSDAIINGLPGIFFLFNLEGKMIRWNKQYEQMLGYTAEEVASRNALDPIAEEDREHTEVAIQNAVVEGQGTVEAKLVTKDGRKIPYYFVGQRLQLDDQLYLAGTGIDITERKRLEAQIQEAFERRGLQVELSTQVSQSIAAASSLPELYDRVVTQIKEQFGYYHTQLLRYDPAQDAVVLVIGYGQVGEQMLAAGHRMPLGTGLIGTAAANGETILRSALANDPDWHPNPLLPETKGEIAVPIKMGDTVLGVLDVQSNVAGSLDADDQLLLEGLCGQIATAIESTRLRQEMADRLEEINRLYRAMSQEGWKSYMATGEMPSGFVYDQRGLQPVTNPGLTEELFSSVPLTVPGGQVIGTLAVAADPQRMITSEEETFLEQVSEQVALALESARLFEQTEEALSWQKAINHTSILIGQARSIPEIVRATAELLPLLRMISCSINVIEELDENGLPVLSNLHIVRYADNEFITMPPLLNQPTTGWLPNDPKYYQLNRVTVFPNLADLTTMVPSDAYQAPGAVAYMRKVGMHSAIALALGVQKRPIGYLTFTSRTPLTQVPEKYITWLGTIVDLIATAIDSQLLLAETERGRQILSRRAAELATVAEVGTTTSSTLEPDLLLQSVVDLAKEKFGLYHAHIYTYDESWKTLLLAAGAGEIGRKLVAEQHAIPMTLEQSLVARAARERRPIIINDVASEPDFLPNPLLPETRAELAVPMTAGDKLLGIFDVQSNNAAGFTDEDANIYVTLATQVAIALQNARLYMEQAALVNQLRELDRLKSSFLANMSHELRTPLNSILGFADVILEELDGPLTENMNNDLRLIQKNGQHLLHLINDVLDMAKIEAGRMNLSPERFTAFEVLEEVTSITSSLASEKNLALFIEEDSDRDVKVFADRTRLRQVMINLVNNAIKFTENGKIAVKLTQLEGARILIRVKDTGIGIPPDKLDAIFQEFTQVDSSSTRKAGGTGLGLPISRRLVEMHGGRLWAESTGNPGEGSTFFVELPIEARLVDAVEKQAK